MATPGLDPDLIDEEPTPEELEQIGKNYGNDPRLEMVWATKAHGYAETHWKLMIACKDPKHLRLTSMDKEIFRQFKERFPEDATNCRWFNEDRVKSKEAKDKWRPFLMEFKDKIPAFNYLTLIRIDALDMEGYTSANTCVVPRAQFIIFEIARNRKGYNNRLLELMGVIPKREELAEAAKDDDKQEGKGVDQ